MDAFDEWYIDVIKHQYADFDGRARRKEYWMFTLFNTLIGFTLYVPVVLGIVLGLDILLYVGILLLIVFAFGTFIPSLAVAVRRLHDTGKSGWFYLLCLVPYIGAFILIYFMVVEGNSGSNEYGPDPKDPYSDDLSNVLDTY